TKGVSMPTIPMAATPVQRDRSRDRVWCAASNSQQAWASASAYPTTAQAPQTRNPRRLSVRVRTSAYAAQPRERAAPTARGRRANARRARFSGPRARCRSPRSRVPMTFETTDAVGAVGGGGQNRPGQEDASEERGEPTLSRRTRDCCGEIAEGAAVGWTTRGRCCEGR